MLGIPAAKAIALVLVAIAIGGTVYTVFSMDNFQVKIRVDSAELAGGPFVNVTATVMFVNDKPQDVTINSVLAAVYSDPTQVNSITSIYLTNIFVPANSEKDLQHSTLVDTTFLHTSVFVVIDVSFTVSGQPGVQSFHAEKTIDLGNSATWSG